MLTNQDIRFAVAPMMDWTDRHCRYFHRLLSRRARLYTEMLTTGAVIHGDRARLMGFDSVRTRNHFNGGLVGWEGIQGVDGTVLAEAGLDSLYAAQTYNRVWSPNRTSTTPSPASAAPKWPGMPPRNPSRSPPPKSLTLPWVNAAPPP